jgi:hypothetical protein
MERLSEAQAWALDRARIEGFRFGRRHRRTLRSLEARGLVRVIPKIRIVEVQEYEVEVLEGSE